MTIDSRLDKLIILRMLTGLKGTHDLSVRRTNVERAWKKMNVCKQCEHLLSPRYK